MKNNSALFYTCSLLEFIGRRQKVKRSELVQFLGGKTIEHIYRYADVFHCEPIEKTADDFGVHNTKSGKDLIRIPAFAFLYLLGHAEKHGYHGME